MRGLQELKELLKPMKPEKVVKQILNAEESGDDREERRPL